MIGEARSRSARRSSAPIRTTWRSSRTRRSGSAPSCGRSTSSPATSSSSTTTSTTRPATRLVYAAERGRRARRRRRDPVPDRGRGEVTDAILGCVTPRTRLALVSHVTSPTASSSRSPSSSRSSIGTRHRHARRRRARARHGPARPDRARCRVLHRQLSTNGCAGRRGPRCSGSGADRQKVVRPARDVARRECRLGRTGRRFGSSSTGPGRPTRRRIWLCPAAIDFMATFLPRRMAGGHVREPRPGARRPRTSVSRHSTSWRRPPTTCSGRWPTVPLPAAAESAEERRRCHRRGALANVPYRGPDHRDARVSPGRCRRRRRPLRAHLGSALQRP